MLRFFSLASGSSGNSQLVETNHTKILIDAGLNGKRIEFLLAEVGVNAKDIDAILLTHEHRDHTGAAGVLARRHGIPLYATPGTWAGIGDSLGKIPQELVKIVDRGRSFALEDVGIYPLASHHDALDPVCYILEWGSRKISIVTDTGWISPPMLTAMEDSDVYYLEANHDVKALREGNYPWHLKERILGTRGHLSNEHAGVCLTKLLQGKGEKVLLGHLSEENNTPQWAVREVTHHLAMAGYEVNEHYDLDVGKRYAPSKEIVFEK